MNSEITKIVVRAHKKIHEALDSVYDNAELAEKITNGTNELLNGTYKAVLDTVTACRGITSEVEKYLKIDPENTKASKRGRPANPKTDEPKKETADNTEDAPKPRRGRRSNAEIAAAKAAEEAAAAAAETTNEAPVETPTPEPVAEKQTPPAAPVTHSTPTIKVGDIVEYKNENTNIIGEVQEITADKKVILRDADDQSHEVDAQFVAHCNI